MSRVDVYILEFMFACDGGDALLTPKVIATNINYQRSYVNSRLKNELVEHGLVADEGNGLYQLKQKGKMAARGDLKVEELEIYEDEE